MVQTKHKPLDQKGFASIVIALVLIIVLALLTIGFAQLARREQQNALTKQLSTQAYDAAESGINDVYQAVRAGGTGTITDQGPNPTPNVDTDNCLGAPWQNVGIGPSGHGVAYTCAIVNLTPTSLFKDPLSPGSGWMTTFSLNGAPSTFTIQWSSTDGQTTPRTSGGFTPAAGWSSPAVLQFSITPLNAMDRASLINNTFNAYLYPWQSGGGSFVYNPSSQGQIVQANCTAGGGCSATMTGLPASGQYLMHIIGYYDSSAITITAHTGPTTLKFGNSQAIIDVTGKAHNVLKRLRVRAPINPESELPNYALEGDACKRFQTDPSGSQPSKPPYYGGTACDLNN